MSAAAVQRKSRKRSKSKTPRTKSKSPNSKKNRTLSKSPSPRTKTTLRRKSDRRTELIDGKIREKFLEYQLALQNKAMRYGYFSHETNQYVLDDEYFLQEPDNWIPKSMGNWVFSVTKTSEIDNAVDDDGPPPAIPLIRSENAQRKAIFNNHYKTAFEHLLAQREHMETLESNDVDIKNAVRTMQKLTKRKHPLGKNEIIKSVVDFVAPNNLTYAQLINSPTRTKGRSRTRSRSRSRPRSI